MEPILNLTPVCILVWKVIRVTEEKDPARHIAQFILKKIWLKIYILACQVLVSDLRPRTSKWDMNPSDRRDQIVIPSSSRIKSHASSWIKVSWGWFFAAWGPSKLFETLESKIISTDTYKVGLWPNLATLQFFW